MVTEINSCLGLKREKIVTLELEETFGHHGNALYHSDGGGHMTAHICQSS